MEGGWHNRAPRRRQESSGRLKQGELARRLGRASPLIVVDPVYFDKNVDARDGTVSTVAGNLSGVAFSQTDRVITLVATSEPNISSAERSNGFF